MKTVRWEVVSANLGAPKVAPYKRWRSTTTSFRASDCS
jgi:hypothetical protein